jgi:mono/diheme cytochrome c family protein
MPRFLTRPGLLLAATAMLAAPLLVPGLAGAQQDPVARGAYLVTAVAACGNCHTPMGPDGPLPGKTLAGGQVVVDIPPFRAVSANITPDKDTGIGDWTTAQIATAIREGKRPDGSTIGFPMPIPLYRGISDTDVAAIAAYLKTLPPVHNEFAYSDYRIPLPDQYGPPVAQVPDPPANDPVARGAYLAGPVAHCIECHTPMAANGERDWTRTGAGGPAFKGPWGESIPANLTPGGLGNLSDDQIVRAITQGIGADGRKLKPPMPFAAYANMRAGDLQDILAYLRSLPRQ